MARLFFNSRLQGTARRAPRVERALLRIEVLIARLLWGVSRLFPVDRASALGAWVGRRIGPRLRKHRHVVRNLSMVFPERDAAWIERTARAAWGQIGRVLAEYPHLATLCATGPDRRIELRAHFDLEDLRRGTRPALLVAMHQANWNLPALTGVLGGLPFTGVFGRQQNPLIEERIERYRNAMGARLIDAADGPRPILAELSEGRSVGLHMDHRVDAGEMLPFFDIEAPTVTIPARLAIKQGVALVPMRIERLEGARFCITLYEPILPDPALADPREAARRMTAQVNAHFERWIRERPDQWVCAKRRWPKEAVGERLAHARAPVDKIVTAS